MHYNVYGTLYKVTLFCKVHFYNIFAIFFPKKYCYYVLMTLIKALAYSDNIIIQSF